MSLQFTAHPIQTRTKGQLRRLRSEGYIPVSIQHKGWETLHLQTEARPLDEFLRRHSPSTLLELVIEPDNKRQAAMIQNLQRDPISQRLLQVTFQAVVRGEPIKAHIPLVFQGEPELARLHTAVVEPQLEQVEVRCLPGDLPDHIPVDISGLTLNAPLHVSDLPVSDRYEILSAPDTVIVTLLAALVPVSGSFNCRATESSSVKSPPRLSVPTAAI
jgi:large subunit ribosomal protein L25